MFRKLRMLWWEMRYRIGFWIMGGLRGEEDCPCQDCKQTACDDVCCMTCPHFADRNRRYYPIQMPTE